MTDTHTKAVTVIPQQVPVAREGMNPLAAKALDVLEKANPENLGDVLQSILDFQKQQEAITAEKAYTVAVAEMRRDLPPVINHDKKVSFGNTKYTHATLANIIEQIEKPLSMHGFALSWRTDVQGDMVTVECVLTHSQGHSKSTAITSGLDKAGGKNNVQQIGSTITYLKRYTATSLLGIATADMPDADDRPKPSPDKKNVADNERAVIHFRNRFNKAAPELEEYLGKPYGDWVESDLAKLREWAASGAGEHSK
jgi:hypothetical protein